MTNQRTILVLLGVFAALVIVSVLQNRPIPVAGEGTPTASPTGTFQRIFPEMAVLDIQAIRLENPEIAATFTISRAEDGTWTAPNHPQFTLDPDAATAIARTVVLLPYEYTIPLTESLDLSEYGFQPNARLYIQVLLTNQESHIVAIGALAPSQTSYYALVDERDTIYLIESHAVAYLISTLATPPVS